MIYLYAFLFCGAACLLAELLYQLTKLTIGHVVCLFIILGSFFELLGIYQIFNDTFGAGASLPISSFGALLTRGAIEAGKNHNIFALLSGVFTYVGAGIGGAIAIAFIVGLIFKPKS